VAFEPDILRIGKAFGVEVQTGYLAGAKDVSGRAEVTTDSGSGQARWLETGRRVEPATARLGRKARVDLLLEGLDEESGLPFLVVLEIKSTDSRKSRQDRSAAGRVGRHRRLVRRARRAVTGWAKRRAGFAANMAAKSAQADFGAAGGPDLACICDPKRPRRQARAPLARPAPAPKAGRRPSPAFPPKRSVRQAGHAVGRISLTYEG
jgi:hypothetical protein